MHTRCASFIFLTLVLTCGAAAEVQHRELGRDEVQELLMIQQPESVGGGGAGKPGSRTSWSLERWSGAARDDVSEAAARRARRAGMALHEGGY